MFKLTFVNTFCFASSKWSQPLARKSSQLILESKRSCAWRSPLKEFQRYCTEWRDVGMHGKTDNLQNIMPMSAADWSLNVSLKRQMFLRERLWHESLFWLMLFICLSETLLRNHQSEFHEIWWKCRASERNNIKIWCRNGPITFYAPGLCLHV